MTIKQNIDSEEIQKFDEIANAWWDEEGDFKPLHQINPLRVNFIAEKVNLRGKKILDVGCGGGILSESLASLGAEVTAIDASEKSINIAKAHARKVRSKVKYLHTTTEEILSDN